MSGVARNSVYPIPSGQENALPISSRYVSIGLSPIASTNSAPMKNAAATAIRGNSSSRQRFMRGRLAS
jgi:hypothetical protein